MTDITDMTLTPHEYIKKEIILVARKAGHLPDYMDLLGSKRVEEVYSKWEENDPDMLYESEYEFREGSIPTDISPDWSRHYESRSVAHKMSDGTWVGWTFWYGGGKHGKPSAMEWMEEAYFLDVVEEEKLVVVREFKKITFESCSKTKLGL